MSLKTVKLLAALTAVMSIPLLLAFNIKYGWLPQGPPYIFVYSWALLSFLVVPVLLFLGLVTTIRIFLSSDAANRSTRLAWNSMGMLVGMVAEVVFLAARNSTP